ncbi:MAG: hypothetical protein L3J79_04220 [Candidatus Marinimicrobia bacterium]|nr:hypothetical protein [Candidatus Neomarinimicrobiota bacterium]MCF6265852.1 hypothetical protein [Desulfuromusa sp.]
MPGQIDPTLSARPISGQQQEEMIQHQQRERTRSTAEDRVSLGQQEKVDETYGPGLKVASPYELLRNLVVKTLQDQGLTLQFSTDAGEVNFKTMTQEEAQALVAEDGYFGVDRTSQRIVDFAIGSFGNDPEKLQQMKDAIDQGFLQAQDAFGGALPEISQQTYDAIMEKLDAFAAQFEASGE